MSKENYRVHVSHCCYIHGCKYGDKDCPVQSGEVAQKHLCYDCQEEYEPYTIEEIELLRKTKSYRPTYKQLKDKVSDLEAKLAEKSKELQECKIGDKNTQDALFSKIQKLEHQLAEKVKENELMAKTLKMTKFVEKEVDQNKISFAVEHLEKVKEEVKHFGYELSKSMHEYIDRQIKAIKGEK